MRRGKPGEPTGRTFSATSSATRCSTRATGGRCSRRRRPATSARPCFAPPTWGALGRKPRSRRTWKTLLKGLEVVEGFDASKPSFHDPHCIRICPSNPDRLYQQNHCGIYRLDRPSDTWERIGKSMPERVGDIGFPMVVHPRDADTAWVFPMSGTTVWPRTSPEGMPAVYATRNGGKTWQRLNAGLPAKQAWWTVKRQAMTADASDPVGLYFGTTSGDLWMSRDEGRRWACIARHLPEIRSEEHTSELQSHSDLVCRLL